VIDAARGSEPEHLAQTAPIPAKSPFRRLWVVGAFLYGGFLWWIGWGRIGLVLASVDVSALLAMAGVIGCALAVRVAKWRLVLGPRAGAIGLYFLAKAGGDWSPGRVGELAPLMLRPYRTARVGAWIVTDRLLEMAATLGLGALGIVAFGLESGMPAIGPMPQARLYNMLVYVAAALIVLVAAPAVILTRRGLFLFLANRLERRQGLRRLSRIASLLVDVSTEVRGFGAKVPMASAMTFLATALDIVVGMLLYRSFGYTLSFMLLAAVQCAHALASAFPFTPNATGVPYLVAAGLLFEVAGVPADVLGASVGVSIAITNAVFWGAFLIGIRARTGAGLNRGPVEASRQDCLFDYLASGDVLYEYDAVSLERLNDLVPDKGRLLDMGCGDGGIAAGLDARSVVALDISPRCAVLASRRGVPCIVADARMPLPFAAGSFDTVYCIDVLHHVPRAAWHGLVAEFHRVLKPLGRLAIVEPDARYAFVRWTQAPRSPIRVAPCPDEPAIDPGRLEPILAARGFNVEREPIRIDGRQACRSVFPMWQRLLKAPFVLALATWHGGRPNKFVLLAHKQAIEEVRQ